MRQATDPEVRADLVEISDNPLVGDAIANPQAGKTVGLGEGAQANQPGVADIQRSEAVLRREFHIGFVENKQAVVRQVGQDLLNNPAPQKGAGWVVRVGQIKQLGLGLPRLGQQGVHVVVARLAVGHQRQATAETGHVVVEGGIGAERGNHGFAGIEERPHDQPQQAVDALADDQILRLYRHGRGEFLPQVVMFRVAVPGATAHLTLQGRQDRGGRAKGAFIGANARLVGRPALALQRLRSDKGDNAWHLRQKAAVGNRTVGRGHNLGLWILPLHRRPRRGGPGRPPS